MAYEQQYRQYTLVSQHFRLTTWLPERYKQKELGTGAVLTLEGDDRVWTVEEVSKTKKTRRELSEMEARRKAFGPSLREED